MECNDLSHTPASYLATVLPKWKKMVKVADPEKGAPMLLIIASAGLRASQLNRYRGNSDCDIHYQSSNTIIHFFCYSHLK